MTPPVPARSARSIDREIFALAVPAFATLVSEPALLLADSAIIGHLGTTQLAGLGIAGNLLGILTGLSIFLAYGTTGTVARRLGAGDLRSALAGGIDGMALAVLLGAALGAVLQLLLPYVISWYGAGPEVSAAATSYLRVAAWGLPSVLVMLAATGVLRGLQDTRTPLIIAVTCNLLNIVLNITFVYGLHFGIAGSATGSLIAQTASAAVLSAVVIRGARRNHVHISFHPRGVLAAARSGVWLVLRTATLQLGITITTAVAAGLGAVGLATHQVTNSLWTFLTFALDAIAIAAQAVIGRYLGAGDRPMVRRLTNRMIGWGLVSGVAFGLIMAVARPLYDQLFSPDPAVQSLLSQVLLVVAAIAPFAGVVFVLDGVLIGAGDGRYLALAGLIAVSCFLPLALTVRSLDAGLVWLWVAYGGYILARLATLLARSRGTGWMRTGM
ncbi:MATE family efflux transporter [Microlunatus sp. Gsoil 973]|uniref:MATE family efflux transporter n=1 Tax=Microlunatus sp. Gsoil 973 TaxID=2672569 RepID=UPI0012B49F3F|nr:MATE family efflux transporter [Microlunatus sp. Gsoil 973]QGN34158.1 MATE family efflux transporter [Microlunatus sp. Gsoil 973]